MYRPEPDQDGDEDNDLPPGQELQVGQEESSGTFIPPPSLSRLTPRGPMSLPLVFHPTEPFSLKDKVNVNIISRKTDG